jgi:hypothetical protein
VDSRREFSQAIVHRYPTVERIEIGYTTALMGADAALLGTSRAQPQTLTLNPDDRTFTDSSCATLGHPLEGAPAGEIGPAATT